VRRKLTLAALTLLLALGIGSSAAYACSISFTLNNPNQSTAPGNTLTSTATVSAASNNSGNVFLNGHSFNVQSPITLDGTDFFANAPFFLVPGQTATFDIFTLTVPPKHHRRHLFGRLYAARRIGWRSSGPARGRELQCHDNSGTVQPPAAGLWTQRIGLCRSSKEENIGCLVTDWAAVSGSLSSLRPLCGSAIAFVGGKV